MKTQILERLPTIAAAGILVLVVAACAIRLRGDDTQTLSATPSDQPSDALTTELAECRFVTYEQKDALSECRKAWAEKRRQFLGQKTPSTKSDNGSAQEGPSLFVPPKDESRLAPGFPSIPQVGKE